MGIDLAQRAGRRATAGRSRALTAAAEFIAAVYTKETTAKNAWSPKLWNSPDEQRNRGRCPLDSVPADVVIRGGSSRAALRRERRALPGLARTSHPETVSACRAIRLCVAEGEASSLAKALKYGC